MWLLDSVGSTEAPDVITDAVGTLHLSAVSTCAPHRRWASFLSKRPHAGLCAQVWTRAAARSISCGSVWPLMLENEVPSTCSMQCMPAAVAFTAQPPCCAQGTMWSRT